MRDIYNLNETDGPCGSYHTIIFLYLCSTHAHTKLLVMSFTEHATVGDGVNKTSNFEWKSEKNVQYADITPFASVSFVRAVATTSGWNKLIIYFLDSLPLFLSLLVQHLSLLFPHIEKFTEKVTNTAKKGRKENRKSHPNFYFRTHYILLRDRHFTLRFEDFTYLPLWLWLCLRLPQFICYCDDSWEENIWVQHFRRAKQTESDHVR